jgi:hypothetical protein
VAKHFFKLFKAFFLIAPRAQASWRTLYGVACPKTPEVQFELAVTFADE